MSVFSRNHTGGREVWFDHPPSGLDIFVFECINILPLTINHLFLLFLSSISTALSIHLLFYWVQTVDQFFALKVPMRFTELNSLFRGIDNALQVYAKHVVNDLGEWMLHICVCRQISLYIL